MLISAFITHKKAEHYSDCQDRFSINPDTKSIALSDGMSQSIFQKYWAEILVESFTKNQDWEPNRESVKELSSIWKTKVDEYIENQKREGKATWRVERSLMDGHSAGATFLGIRFTGLNWEGSVLGDSCLVLVNDNQIKEIYSSEDVEVFDNYPDFFDSNPQKEGKGTPKQISGSLKRGDSLLLVSDPFSDFLLKNKGTAEEAILVDRLLGVNSPTEFEEVVEQWRNKGMHNDDSTLVIIKSDGTEDFTILHEDNIQTLIEEEAAKINQSKENEQTIQSEIELMSPNAASQGEEEDISIEEESIQFDFHQIFDNVFFEDMKATIYKELKIWELLKLQRKQITFSIAEEIQSLIHHTIRKKCQ